MPLFFPQELHLSPGPVPCSSPELPFICVCSLTPVLLWLSDLHLPFLWRACLMNWALGWPWSPSLDALLFLLVPLAYELSLPALLSPSVLGPPFPVEQPAPAASWQWPHVTSTGSTRSSWCLLGENELLMPYMSGRGWKETKACLKWLKERQWGRQARVHSHFLRWAVERPKERNGRGDKK